MDNKYYRNEKQNCIFIIFIMFVVFNYFALLMAYSMNATNQDLMAAMSLTMDNLKNFKLTCIGFNIKYLCYSMFVWAIASLYLYSDLSIKKNMRPGEEHGSAKWFDNYKAYNKKYVDPKDENNMIFTEEVKLSMDSHRTKRNCHSLIIGGSGTGKSRYWVKPNILQTNCSYVITDPSGELLRTEGKFLKNQGYKVSVFNLVDPNQSSHYNPFHYIRDEDGVLDMIKCLIQNTNDGKSGGDPFWEKSETAFLLSLCFYLIEKLPKKEQNFANVIKLINLCEVRDDDPDFKNAVDYMMEDLEKKNPESMAVANWKIFKLAPGKTAMSILVSAGVRLNTFNFSSIKELTSTDDIQLESIGDQKTALFVVIPSSKGTLNFLVSMMYSQLFETLDYIGSHNDPQVLKVPVRFLLDEFCNVGVIPEFDKKIATIRKFNMSCAIIIQSMAQLKEMYDKKTDGIIDNCDTVLFLGAQGIETIEFINKKLGKQTIITKSRSSNVGGKSGGGSRSYQSSGRDLMTPEEISQLDDDKCLLFIRGIKPFFCHKFPLEKHKNFMLSGDGNNDLLYFYEKEHHKKELVKSKQKTDLAKKPRPVHKERTLRGVETCKSKPLSETCKEIAIKNEKAELKVVHTDEFKTDKEPIKTLDLKKAQELYQKQMASSVDDELQNINLDLSSMINGTEPEETMENMQETDLPHEIMEEEIPEETFDINQINEVMPEEILDMEEEDIIEENDEETYLDDLDDFLNFEL